MAQDLSALTGQAYKYGFVTDIESESVDPGLSEDVIRLISAKRKSPNGCWLGDLRLTNIGSP